MMRSVICCVVGSEIVEKCCLFLALSHFPLRFTHQQFPTVSAATQRRISLNFEDKNENKE